VRSEATSGRGVVSYGTEQPSAQPSLPVFCSSSNLTSLVEVLDNGVRELLVNLGVGTPEVGLSPAVPVNGPGSVVAVVVV
jgi:hypothetical protein